MGAWPETRTEVQVYPREACLSLTPWGAQGLQSRSEEAELGAQTPALVSHALRATGKGGEVAAGTPGVGTAGRVWEQASSWGLGVA